eukprot:XP_011677439.1 PREDICTED: EGF-like repeat and discoidin I-like domain-containing protein 3 [Strongylocentrotus purpuratus]
MDVGDAYTFDLFVTERKPCSSELFFEFQNFDFPLDDEPVIAASFHTNEWTGAGVDIGTWLISEFNDIELYVGEVVEDTDSGMPAPDYSSGRCFTKECYTDPQGFDYRGNVSVTENGNPCQKWSSQHPHTHPYTPGTYPGLGDHNYCRNPSSESAPFCITAVETVKEEYCNVGPPQRWCYRETFYIYSLLAGAWHAGAWCAKDIYPGNWLQADLGGIHLVAGVMTQGRHDHPRWVTTFHVGYSTDSTTWFLARNMANDEIFDGNTEQYYVLPNYFSKPVPARYIRVIPLIYAPVSQIACMRMELIGVKYETDLNALEIPSPSSFVPLGMEDGRIKDDQITQSTCWNENHCAFRARLNIRHDNPLTGGWVPQNDDIAKWVKVALKEVKLIGGVVTQGRDQLKQWTSSFKVDLSLDGSDWTTAKDASNSEV